jgi:hypothetical protein
MQLISIQTKSINSTAARTMKTLKLQSGGADLADVGQCEWLAKTSMTNQMLSSSMGIGRCQWQFR